MANRNVRWWRAQYLIVSYNSDTCWMNRMRWIFREQRLLAREGSNFFCSTSQKSSNNFSHLSRNNHGSSPQHLAGNLSLGSTLYYSSHHRSWIFSTSSVSKLSLIILLKVLRRSMTSWIICDNVNDLTYCRTHFDDLNRLLLHAPWPSKLRSLFRFTGPKKDLQSFLDNIHKVFCWIRVI